MGGIGRLQGAATQWDDITFAASTINPSGGAAAATIDTNSGVLLFAGNADQTIAGSFQMYHCWKEGSTIYPHLHLRFPTSATADTRWKFDYEVANINGAFTSALGTYANSETITVANPADTTKHVIAPFTGVAMTGKTISCIVLWRLQRLASSDAADNDTNAAALLAIDFHYEIDSIGSEDEYVK
jgi:hypothetical protein